ncbi:MAG TPA: histidine phosphatase family protein [Candidatus Atribacteria bacterium]|nr:histidine phosphatase family protein [Candidatus Atribacteria bacterium]
MAIKLLLIRHGESYGNAQKKFSGSQDVILTEKGIWQAERLAYRLKGLPIDAVYCSDLKRAVHTANIIFGNRNINIIINPNLREMNFGIWEGKTFEEIELKEGAKFTSWMENPDERSIIPQGESLALLNKRIMTEVNRILQEHKDENNDKTIAIVCHGGAIRTILCNALNIELKNLWYIKQKSTALNIIDYYDSRGFVSLINDTSHLEDWWESGLAQE